jgi:hypothetical protein
MYDLGEHMNFNYLLNEYQRKQRCKDANQECYWVPTGNIRSMVGEHVNVSLYCRQCGRHEELFLTAREFKVQEKLITSEVKREEKRV